MQNPWISIPLDTYENHMMRADIFQAQTLAARMRARFADRDIGSVTILGIAGGNGLEHAEKTHLRKITGIDVNADYLEICRQRFLNLSDRLELICADLSDPALALSFCDLLTADLLIEYIGTDCFVSLIRRSRPRRISCTLQSDGAERSGFVSGSPYQSTFEPLSEIHRSVNPNELCEALARLDYILTKKTMIDLPNGKAFVCLEFGLDLF